jgi:hypothetical protein
MRSPSVSGRHTAVNQRPARCRLVDLLAGSDEGDPILPRVPSVESLHVGKTAAERDFHHGYPMVQGLAELQRGLAECGAHRDTISALGAIYVLNYTEMASAAEVDS